MSVSVGQAELLLRDRLGHSRFITLDEVAKEGSPDGIGVTLLVALGIRETGLRNIEGDGGHGAGWLQIDRRFHYAWLHSRAGCKSGSWEFAHGHRASERGYVPGCTAAADYAIQLLRGNRAYGKAHGVHSEHLTHFMVTAYNCGAGNAIAAYRRYGSGGLDSYTTGRNYGRDVLSMHDAVADAAKRLHWHYG